MSLVELIWSCADYDNNNDVYYDDNVNDRYDDDNHDGHFMRPMFSPFVKTLMALTAKE